MIETLKLYLIRHAPVKKFEGYIPKKNPNAVINFEQLKRIAAYIPSDSTCYVSPLKRAKQTAKALSKYFNFKKIIVEKKLIEQNFGEWEGKKISRVWDELKTLKNKHNFSFICPETKPPKGDSFLDQCKRTSAFIENLNFNDYRSLVIIAHSGTIRALLSHVLGMDPNIAIGIKISYLSLTTFEVLKKTNLKNSGGRYRLLNINHKIT